MSEGLTPAFAQLSKAQARWLATARTGNLATADAGDGPHVIPVCFVFDGQAIYSVLDQKPKRVVPARLRRVRNIRSNPGRPWLSITMTRTGAAWDTFWSPAGRSAFGGR